MGAIQYIRNVLPVFWLTCLLLALPGTLFSQGCSFTVTTIPTHVKCNGMATGSISLKESPAGTYSYLWSTGATSNSISGLEAGTYFVKVTDHTGCEVISFITITQPPALDYSAVIEHPVCYNENSGSIQLNVSGGVSPYDYNWTNNVKTANNPDLYSGRYECTITDANFCTKTADFELIQPEKMTTRAEITDVRGYGLSDGSINISTSGGIHPYKYSWSSDSGFAASTEDIYNVAAATYTLDITDSKECSYDTSIIVSQPPPLSLTSEITNVFCNAFSDGSIFVRVSGGVPPYRYSWANEEIILTEPTEHLRDLPMGSYYLTVTDHNDITLSDSFYVDQPNSIVASISVADAWCYDSLNGSAMLTVSGGVPPFSFLWSNGNNKKDLVNVHAGSYEVEIVDSKGCFLRVATEVGQPDSIKINTTVQHVTCKDHYNGKIFTNVQGGIPPYSYRWSNGAITESIEQLSIGEYSVTVTDHHDCPMHTTELITRPIDGCIEIPNAFTPNGDNMNDRWIIKNSYLYPDIEVMVFNKEGYTVYEDIGYTNAWDGTYNDYDVAPGTYYYLVNLHNGDPVYKGIVTIIR
jgi:gliding motility-associated-like protein